MGEHEQQKKPISTEQELLHLVRMGALSFVNQDEELILYKTYPHNKLLTLKKKYPSKEELFETLLSNPHFLELLADTSSVNQWVQKQTQYPEQRQDRVTLEGLALEGLAQLVSAKLENKRQPNQFWNFIKKLFRQLKPSEKKLEVPLTQLTQNDELAKTAVVEQLQQANRLREAFAKGNRDLVYWWLGILGFVTLLNPFIPCIMGHFNWCSVATPYSDPLLMVIWDPWSNCSGSPPSAPYSEHFLMVLWGTATASVIGLLAYVTKYLFPANGGGNNADIIKHLFPSNGGDDPKKEKTLRKKR